MSKIIALDIGTKWTGIAISDSEKKFAFPYKTTETEKLPDALEQILKTEQVATIVVGMPLTMKGAQGIQCQRTKKISIRLQKSVKGHNLNWLEIDERFSSKIATSLSQDPKKSISNRSEHANAAAVILENFLAKQTFLLQ